MSCLVVSAAACGLVLIFLALYPLPWERWAREASVSVSRHEGPPAQVRVTVAVPRTEIAFVGEAGVATVEPAQYPTAAQVDDRIEAAASISIPELGVNASVVPVGWSVQWRDDEAVGVWGTVRDAAGHHRGSADPGQPGNCVISGHSSDIAGAVFSRLSEARPGQAVEVTDQLGRRFEYLVSEVVRLDETGAGAAERQEHALWLEPTQESVLTLVTCWPEWGYTHRIVVRAELSASSSQPDSQDLSEERSSTEARRAVSAPERSHDASGDVDTLELIVWARQTTVGPDDVIPVIVNVTNGGSSTVDDVVIEAELPEYLDAAQTDFTDSTWSQDTRQLSADIGSLSAGDDVSFHVRLVIGRDAWPGQNLESVWRVRVGRDESSPVTFTAILPWSELPATGLCLGAVPCGE